MNSYTVVGYYDESGESFVDHIAADSARNAYFICMRQREPGISIIAIFEGSHFDLLG